MEGGDSAMTELPILVTGLGQRTSPRTFSRPFEAIRQFVENAMAVGDQWNASRCAIELADGLLTVVDDGAGCEAGQMHRLLNVGSTKQSRSIYSFYGTGFYHACNYLATETLVVSASSPGGPYQCARFGLAQEARKADSAAGETYHAFQLAQTDLTGATDSLQTVCRRLEGRAGLAIQLELKQAMLRPGPAGRIEQRLGQAWGCEGLCEFLGRAWAPDRLEAPDRTGFSLCSGLPDRDCPFELIVQAEPVSWADSPLGRTRLSSGPLEATILFGAEGEGKLPVRYCFGWRIEKSDEAAELTCLPELLVFVNGRALHLSESFFPKELYRQCMKSVASYPGSAYQQICYLCNDDEQVPLPFLSCSEFKAKVSKNKRQGKRYAMCGCGGLMAVEISQEKLHELNDLIPDALSFDAGKEIFRCNTPEALRKFKSQLFTLYFKACFRDYQLEPPPPPKPARPPKTARVEPAIALRTRYGAPDDLCSPPNKRARTQATPFEAGDWTIAKAPASGAVRKRFEIGTRIRVKLDGDWYRGSVCGFNKSRGHQVLYDDGEQLWHMQFEPNCPVVKEADNMDEFFKKRLADTSSIKQSAPRKSKPAAKAKHVPAGYGTGSRAALPTRASEPEHPVSRFREFYSNFHVGQLVDYRYDDGKWWPAEVERVWPSEGDKPESFDIKSGGRGGRWADYKVSAENLRPRELSATKRLVVVKKEKILEMLV